jgi:tRNA(fMet)-specific endonuclease VapC
MGRSLIDTSILIDAEKRRLSLDDYTSSDTDEEYYLSVITVSELLHGVHRAKDVSVRNRRSAIVEELLDRFPILNIDLKTARYHARIWADLESAGNMIGMHDLWLAATCLAHSLTIITGNIREFRRVSGIEVVRWGDPLT